MILHRQSFHFDTEDTGPAYTQVQIQHRMSSRRSTLLGARSLSRFPPVSKKCKNRVPPNIVFRSRYSTVRVPAIVTHLPRAPSFRRPPSSRRGEALWEQVWRQARVRWGRPLLSRPRGAFGSGHLRIEPACLCDPCARERPSARVSRACPVCVPAPPVSFYRPAVVRKMEKWAAAAAATAKAKPSWTWTRSTKAR